MTDPTGISFLSYRRNCEGEAKLLIEAQHDVGIPTWQDVDNLGSGQTEQEIRRVLQDPQTSNAVLWLTADVKDSAMIQVELDQALKRNRKDDGFFLVPVAARGLTYGDVSRVSDTLEDLSTFNIRRRFTNAIGPAEAAEVAGIVLEERIKRIHRRLPPGEPFRIALYTREAPPYRPGSFALGLDWSHRFQGREATPEAWEKYLLPAIKRVGLAVGRLADGREVQVEGLAALPAALALGCSFLDTRGNPVSWNQKMPQGGTPQVWSLSVPRESSGFLGEVLPHRTDGKDLAVLLSITEDVENALTRSAIDRSVFRAMVKIGKGDEYPYRLNSAGEGVDVVLTLVQKVREARRAYKGLEKVHLFMSAPVGIAMMIGQQLNTLEAVQTYECLGRGATGEYRPAAMLLPNDWT